MSDPTSCCPDGAQFCARCDLLVGLDGLHVIGVERHGNGALTVMVESEPGLMGCPVCGVVAHGHGRIDVRLVDAPAFGCPVTIIWRKRRWVCPDPGCEVRSFVEKDDQIVRPRSKMTVRACHWAISQLRREHASINGLRRQLGASWGTVWESVRPLLEAADRDPTRFTGVSTLGVDEHIWHHVSTKPFEQGGRGPKELTGMVDLTRDSHGNVHARLLDLVPGRSGRAYADWLKARGADFTSGVQIATLDPFHGYKNAIDDELEDAVAVLDAFLPRKREVPPVVKLATKVVDDVRRRVQTDIHGHRGRRDDPLFKIRNTLRAGQEKLTERQQQRLTTAWQADERHIAVEVAWQCSQQVRSVYHQPTDTAGRAIAEKILDTFHTCPIPEVARLGRTLRQWREAFLGYFDTHGANNGGTEAINGLIELHRRVARGFRNLHNYRLRMLLIAGGLKL